MLAVLLSFLILISGGDTKPSPEASQPFLVGIKSSDDFSKLQRDRLEKAQTLLNSLTSFKGKRTIENTLTVYDDILKQLDLVSQQTGLIQNVHPDSAFRASSEILSQEASDFGTKLSLNRDVYDALSGLDISKADAQTKFYVEKTLRSFRLSGIDKDEATRNKIRALNEELVKIGQEFSRNIRADVKTVTAKDVKELDGLPEDFIKNKKVEADGSIILTINYPDAIPVFKYAKSEDLRKRMYIAYNNRAYPQNIDVLNKMIAKRNELAKLIGFDSWANYITNDKMIKNAQNASDFIEKISKAATPKSKEDYQSLLDRKKQDDPSATTINLWEYSYYSELVRKSSYNFDSQIARPYFPYDKVKQGVLDVTSTLFGVNFKHNNSIPVWDASVECWEMYEGSKLVGRFYLDMHPRQNKYNHAAQFGVRTGIENVQIPEAALICNFPGGDANDPGLMEHGDVETFFHEFGHLIHTLFAGHLNWVGVGGIQTEWDFVEAPSQMLEEWTWDPKVLSTFAKNYQTNEPIPAEMVAKMKAASEFGKATNVRTQMLYAKLSLSCYDRDPSLVNTDELVKNIRENYTLFHHVDGTHFQTSFGHLDGYSAIYYTYMWSLVIAKDMFSKFDKNNLLDPKVATLYRNKILVPGGSKPADVLVKDFLGRDISFSSWEKWLNETK